jgi:DNA end-binding protein Ku
VPGEGWAVFAVRVDDEQPLPPVGLHDAPGQYLLQAAGVGYPGLTTINGPHVRRGGRARQGVNYQRFLQDQPAATGSRSWSPPPVNRDASRATVASIEAALLWVWLGSFIGKNGYMPRAIWSGSVSFGLVNVPVKLLSATSPKDVRFHQLHDADGGRIQQKRVCSLDGEEVPFEHIVKGYDLGGGRYVMVEPEELAALDVAATRTIDIEEFVDLADIDPVYYERSYYLVPDGRAEKPYALLVETMTRTGKVAVGRFVLRTKQYLATLRARDGVLVLATMLFDDEVVPPEDLEVPTAAETGPSEREVNMATQLVESLTAPFEPSKYADDYREKVLALIEAKAEGDIIAQPEPPAETAPVVDLMAALEASLAAARKNSA